MMRANETIKHIYSMNLSRDALPALLAVWAWLEMFFGLSYY